MTRRPRSLANGLALLLVAGLLLAGQLVLQHYLDKLDAVGDALDRATRRALLGQSLPDLVLLAARQPAVRERLDRSLETLLRAGPEAEPLVTAVRRYLAHELALEELLRLEAEFVEGLETVRNELELRRDQLSLRLRYLQLALRTVTLGSVLLLAAWLLLPAQRELERADTRLARVLENSAELIGSLDAEGRLTYVNQNWGATLGYADLLGRPLAELLAPDSRELWEMARKPGDHRLELLFLNQAGKRVQVEGVVTWEPEGAGSCFWRDVTQTRRLQETFDRFFHMSPDMLCITDRQGRFLKLNPAWQAAAGYAPDEQLGHSFLEYVHPEDLAGAQATALRLAQGGGGEVGSFETRARRADGVYRWLLWTCAFDSREQVFYTTVRDITERRQLEDDLREAKQQAEQASRSKSAFLANMSHELRTPLNSILGFSQLLADESFGPLNERQARQVGNILTSGKNLLALISDILDLSKIEVGRLTIDPFPIPLRTALRQQLHSMEPQAQARKIELRLQEEIPDDLQVIADPGRFGQIVLNLLSNAIKFTEEGGLVQVGVTPAEQEVWIWVQDNGLGVKPQDQQRIFERFEQVDTTLGRRQQGTGLGLALSRQLVELHGGKMDVTSTGVEGEGSRFEFSLPRG